MQSREKLDSPLQKMYNTVRSSVSKSELSPTEYIVDPYSLFYDFTPQQQEEYQEKAVELLNEIFKKSNLTEIPSDFMRTFKRAMSSNIGSRNSFTGMFKKNNIADGEKVMVFPCPLTEIVQMASVEVPNTYEFYRVPTIIYELTNYYDDERLS